MAILIEDIRFEEVGAIRRLYEQSSEQLKSDFRDPTIFANRKWWWIARLSQTPLAGLLPARVHIKVAKSDGELVGFCYVAERRGRGDLGIMVKEGFQGKGIGAMLIDAAIAGRRNVHLSVLHSNERARALYRRFGFETEAVIEYMVKK